MKDAGRFSGPYSLLGRFRALTVSVFGIVIVENFGPALYAGTRGILSGFFIIPVVRFFFVSFLVHQLRSSNKGAALSHTVSNFSRSGLSASMYKT